MPAAGIEPVTYALRVNYKVYFPHKRFSINIIFTNNPVFPIISTRFSQILAL
ncbi:hypothetical protein [Enterococcus faecalis]|uniref:hypothetical protein n=1 Tax=Enterococcus faecalis TaxID=1351 RepID=UPI002ED4E356